MYNIELQEKISQLSDDKLIPFNYTSRDDILLLEVPELGFINPIVVNNWVDAERKKRNLPKIEWIAAMYAPMEIALQEVFVQFNVKETYEE